MRFSNTEWQIMNALWKRNPATAREVIEQIPGEVKWAYTTVKTMLTRLVAKEAVSEHKRGNTSFYEPLIKKEQAQKGAVTDFLSRVLDGAVGPIVHFLIEEKKISKKEREELIRMLRQNEGDRHD